MYSMRPSVSAAISTTRAGAVSPLTTIVRMIASADWVRTRTLDCCGGASLLITLAGASCGVSPAIWPDASHTVTTTTMPAEINQDRNFFSLPKSI